MTLTKNSSVRVNDTQGSLKNIHTPWIETTFLELLDKCFKNREMVMMSTLLSLHNFFDYNFDFVGFKKQKHILTG